jgi:hypothetical protein
MRIPKINLFSRKTLADRITDRVESARNSPTLSKKLTPSLSINEINRRFKLAVSSYNSSHKEKIFND